ncbi:hypothetical protein NMG60_11032883 [Bertholletia excelsa]
MSLVRSGDQYTRSYGNSTPCILNGNSDKHKIAYTTESYASKNCDPKCFLNYPVDEFVHSSCSSNSVNRCLSHGASSTPSMAMPNPFNWSAKMSCQNVYYPNFGSKFLESPITDATDYDEEKMKLKLQELERALLDDKDDDAFGTGRSMEIDDEWASSICNLLLHDLPEESSSLDSNLNSISSNKEISQVSSPRDSKQLLFDCAAMISEGSIREASALINDLRQKFSIQGDPSQRIAAYMVEALAARVSTSGKGLYKALKCKEPPSNDRLSAMQVLFEVCPCFRFGFLTANGAILEAFKNEKRVHIIDFDINQGSQYITLLQSTANQPGKPPHLILTGVDDPESVQRAVGGLQLIGQRLEKLAEALQVPFEFRAVAAKTSMVTAAVLDCQPGQAIVVNFAFQLHHMPDESVSTVNQRDQLLRMVKGLNPKLVTVVEQDVNTNTAPFFQRFVEAYNYYSAVFDSLDATLPRNSKDRMNVEKQCLARDIVNVVACEGEERIERYEVAGKWRARMMMAGFTPHPLSTSVKKGIRDVIKQYSERYKVREEIGSLHFGWEDKVLIVASVWR